MESILFSKEAFGLFGTLSGTILGFFLQRITRFGELKMFQNKLTMQLFESDGVGGYLEVSAISKGEDNFFSKIDLWCDFFNTSESSNKIARGIYLELKSKHETIEKEILIESIDDKYMGTKYGGPVMNNLNFLPKQLTNYHLLVIFHEQHIDFASWTLSIKYKDGKNRSRKFEIDKKMLNRS